MKIDRKNLEKDILSIEQKNLFNEKMRLNKEK
jgi:hypothetical protein